MRWISASSVRSASRVTLFATLVLASAAGAFPLRSPQVVYQTAPLQGVLNGLDGGVNASTDQLDAQHFASSATGIADFVLVIQVGASAGNDTIGIYNAAAAAPTLHLLFPPGATAMYSVMCRFFGPGPNASNLAVTLFDANATVVGSTTYTGVTRDAFGLYIRNRHSTYYSQDARNGGLPQVLTYQGTGINAGDLWECFSDMPYAPNLSTFDAAVLAMEVFQPGQCRGALSRVRGLLGIECTPTLTPTWGQLKSIYR
jgi:hypothetical protein